MNEAFSKAIKSAGVSYTQTQFEQDFATHYGHDELLIPAKSTVILMIEYCADLVNLDEYKICQMIEQIAKRRAELSKTGDNSALAENIAEELLQEWKLATY